MKMKEEFKHSLWTFLFVLGSVFSMVVSSAFTTTNAWAATANQREREPMSGIWVKFASIQAVYGIWNEPKTWQSAWFTK